MLANTRSGYRLYKISAATGALMNLPLILAFARNSWSAFAQRDRYTRGSEELVYIIILKNESFAHDLLESVRTASGNSKATIVIGQQEVDS